MADRVPTRQGKNKRQDGECPDPVDNSLGREECRCCDPLDVWARTTPTTDGHGHDVRSSPAVLGEEASRGRLARDARSPRPVFHGDAAAAVERLEEAFQVARRDRGAGAPISVQGMAIPSAACRRSRPPCGHRNARPARLVREVGTAAASARVIRADRCKPYLANRMIRPSFGRSRTAGPAGSPSRSSIVDNNTCPSRRSDKVQSIGSAPILRSTATSS